VVPSSFAYSPPSDIQWIGSGNSESIGVDLAGTLERLVDFDRINDDPKRLLRRRRQEQHGCQCAHDAISARVAFCTL
jgi:hypothetical protein